MAGSPEKEAAHHEFVDVFVGTMILLCVLAVSVWDVLVFVLLWPIEAVVRRTAMPAADPEADGQPGVRLAGDAQAAAQ